MSSIDRKDKARIRAQRKAGLLPVQRLRTGSDGRTLANQIVKVMTDYAKTRQSIQNPKRK